MKTGMLITGFLLLLLLYSASAFTLTATLGTSPLSGDAVFYEDGARWGQSYHKDDPAGSAGQELYTLQTRYKADYPAIIAEKGTQTVSLGDNPSPLPSGNFVFTLDGVWPKAFLRGGKCAGSACIDGPMFSVVVKHDGASYCGSGWMPVKQGNIGAPICGQGKLGFRVTSFKAPEYKETWLKVNGKKQTWYLLRTAGGKVVVPGVDPTGAEKAELNFCVSLLINGKWSECVETEPELKALLSGSSGGSAPVNPSGTTGPSQIAERINQNTQSTANATDSTVQNSAGAVSTMGDEEFSKCSHDLHQKESLFVAKTRFRYDRGIGYPPGATGYNEFVEPEIEDKEPVIVDLRQQGSEEHDVYSLFLAAHKPKEVSLSGSTTKEPMFMTSVSKNNTQLNCSASWVSENKEVGCGSPDLLWKVYDYKAPYFKETTPAEKQSTGKNELLTKGPHCYDVWVYYMLKFKKSNAANAGYTWWMKSQDELDNYNSSVVKGWNLRITVQDEAGIAIAGARVVVSGRVEGEDWSTEATTDSQGTASFIVPLNKSLNIKASKETYREGTLSNVVVSTELEKTITLLRATYNMPFIFSKDDFWKLWYEVLPAFLEPKQATKKLYLPANSEERKKFLSDKQYTIVRSPYTKKLYANVDKFFWWQEQPCDKGSSTRVKMSVTDQYHARSPVDYMGFKIPAYDVLVFEGLRYNETYYSCTLIPAENRTDTLEVTWQVDADGKISWNNRRLIKGKENTQSNPATGIGG